MSNSLQSIFGRLFARKAAAAPKPRMSKTSKGILAGGGAALTLAIGLVAPWEGLELRAYRDIVGVLTICYGETNGVRPGQTATKTECDSMLARQLVTYEGYLDRCLTATVPVKTKISLISWTYNVGGGAACGSTLVRKANAGDITGACNELPKWNRAGGQVVRGLTNRRQAERQLCLEGVKEGV